MKIQRLRREYQKGDQVECRKDRIENESKKKK